MLLKNHLEAAPPSHRSECPMFPTFPTTICCWVFVVVFLPSVELLQVVFFFFFFFNSWEPFDSGRFLN